MQQEGGALHNYLLNPLAFDAPITVQGEALIWELSTEQDEWDESLPLKKQHHWRA